MPMMPQALPGVTGVMVVMVVMVETAIVLIRPAGMAVMGQAMGTALMPEPVLMEKVEREVAMKVTTVLQE